MQVKINVLPSVLQTKKSTWSLSGNILDYLVQLIGLGFLALFFFPNLSVVSQK